VPSNYSHSRRRDHRQDQGRDVLLLANVVRLIRGVRTFIDKVEVNLPRHLSKRERETIRVLNEGRLAVAGYRTNRPFTTADGQRIVPKYPAEVDLLRPTRGTLAYVARIVPKYRIKWVEFACDYLTDSWADAEDVLAFLNHHVLQRWHGRYRSRTYEETVYGRNKRKTSRNYVRYADRYHKPDDDLSDASEQRKCCHTEIRLTNEGDALRKHRADKLHLLADFDFRQLFERELRLVEITKPAAVSRFADNVVEEQAKARMRCQPRRYNGWMRAQFGAPLKYYRRFIAGALAHRAQMDGRQSWAAWDVQRLAETFPGILHGRSQHLSAAEFLPPRAND
jgi:hypothetical protein